MSGLHFEAPMWLALLPLALLPLARGMRHAAQPTAWLALVPRDTASVCIDWLLRLCSATAIAATVLALAGPYRPGQIVERVGQGAEIVMVIDRSSSMDEGFRGAGRDGTLRNLRPAPGEDTKASVARDVIARFVAAREHDAFSMVMFSLYPMAFVPFTQKTSVMQAAIDASRIGRGLGNTDIGAALLAAAAEFEGRAYAGSRVIVLVSDGGAHLEDDVRLQIAQALRRQRVSLYWIYLRGAFGQKLVAQAHANPQELSQLPEQSLHEFFGKLGLPYKAYEAVEVASVQAALDDLARLERHPLHYTERTPRTDWASAALLWALAASGVVLLSRLWGLRLPQAWKAFHP
jgi:mxaC protein